MSDWSPDVLGPDFEARTLMMRPDSEGPVCAVLVRYAPDAPHVGDMPFASANPQGRGRSDGEERPAVDGPDDPQEAAPSRSGASAEAAEERRATPGAAEERRATPEAMEKPRTARRTAILYVHGFVDYFFQTGLAMRCHTEGYGFYALDLRKYGRALRDWQTPNFCRSLREYDEELDEALRIVREEEGFERVVAMGHSTGGLLVPLWANDRPGGVEAVVLNSPWLAVNGSWFERNVASRAMYVIGPIAPRLPVSSLQPHYGTWLHDPEGGGWDYDLRWKPHEGFPVRAAWLGAIRRGQARVARGLEVDCPILLAASDRSGPHKAWHAELDRTDSVLDVADMVRLGPGLGRDVTLVRIPGGIHDLALSPAPAREAYYREVFTWLAERLDDGSAEQSAAATRE